MQKRVRSSPKALDTTWYIFRHGLATHSWIGYGDNIMTAPLLPEGRPPIERLGKYLQTQPQGLAFMSPVPRCVQTAEIVSQATGRVFQVDERVTEYDPDVEAFEELCQRTQLFIADISRQQPEAVWVCTHGADIAALKHLILQHDFSEIQLMDFPQPGQLLTIRGKQVEMKDFN